MESRCEVKLVLVVATLRHAQNENAGGGGDRVAHRPGREAPICRSMAGSGGTPGRLEPRVTSPAS